MIEFLDWFQLIVLGGLAILGISRGMALYARKIRVVIIDPQMPFRLKLIGMLFIVCFLLWIYEAIAHTLSFPYHLPPSLLHSLLIQSIWFKFTGVIIMLIGLLIYGLALWAFGDYWRIGIDQNTSGHLITKGIFSRSRNPIYLSLDLLIIGTFLLQGHLLFLILALCILAILHEQIRQEEFFLIKSFGDAYHDYCSKVGRYWSF